MLPHNYDRSKEKAGGIIKTVAAAQAEGRLPISVPIASSLPPEKAKARAEYIARRIWNVWRNTKKEAEEAGMESPEFPIIARQGNTLIFKMSEELEYTIVEGDITKGAKNDNGS